MNEAMQNPWCATLIILGFLAFLYGVFRLIFKED